LQLPAMPKAAHPDAICSSWRCRLQLWWRSFAAPAVATCSPGGGCLQLPWMHIEGHVDAYCSTTASTDKPGAATSCKPRWRRGGAPPIRASRSRCRAPRMAPDGGAAQGRRVESGAAAVSRREKGRLLVVSLSHSWSSRERELIGDGARLR
jgi:hypothetical protein